MIQTVISECDTFLRRRGRVQQEVFMKRREFIAFLGGMALAAPRETIAQTSKIFRLGPLTVGPPIAPTAGTGEMLIAGLAQRGYTLGQNLAYEARGAAGKIGPNATLVPEIQD